MTAVSVWMKTSDMGREAVHQRAGGWGGIGWTDSSWELARGLEVVEDLPVDAWPMEFPQLVATEKLPPQKS